jgi:hypothetical protein
MQRHGPMLSRVGKQSGQSVIAIFLSIAILFGGGIAAFQFAGLGLRSWQLKEAATAGAVTLAGVGIADPTGEPCWQATDGLQRPTEYADSATCQEIVAHLTGLDPDRATVRVTQALPKDGGTPLITVAVTYRDPVTSPLLRVLFGSTFTSTSEATVLGQ